MVGVDPSLAAPDPETSRLLAAGIGGVIYIPATQAAATQVKGLSDALHAASPIAPVIAVDQEGGQVVRLTGPGFDAMPSAADQGKMTTPALRTAAKTWATQLRSAGIDLDLAPVADVVAPELVGVNEPVSLLGRGFGTDPAAVGTHVGAFMQGFRDGGVGTTLKHFPGLGGTTTNTDFGVAADDTTTLDSKALLPFELNAAKADMVMVSTVRYTKIDADHLAAFSPVVMKAVRKDLGFVGPIISDDLGAAMAVADVAPGERATRFLAAGGDMVITVDATLVDAMATALAARAETEPAFGERLVDAAERIVALKASRGLATCS